MNKLRIDKMIRKPVAKPVMVIQSKKEKKLEQIAKREMDEAKKGGY